jgi:hypothetical protein
MDSILKMVQLKNTNDCKHNQYRLGEHTKDKDGNLYVGDFGNNDNERKVYVFTKLIKIFN